MIRLLFIILFLFVQVDAKGNIDYKIHKTSSKLHKFSKNYVRLNKKMSLTAKAILRQKRKILKQDKYLKKLEDELKLKEVSYKGNVLALKSLRDKQEKLKDKQDKIEQELVFVISKSVSLSVVIEDENAVNTESLIEFEVLKAMLQNSKKKAKELNKIYYANSKVIDSMNKQVTALETSISMIDTKRRELLETKKKNKTSLDKLKMAKASYKKKVKSILRKQDILKRTLARLNIIKIDATRKAREDKNRKIAFSNQEITDESNLLKVKKHGSSYKRIKTKKYYGKKTISPLTSYTITKRYGTYTDPIYGIKIFNESISLKPKRAGEKVKTVFNGKVIYADKTAVLKNIVIMEHKNGLHTIYANLSKIAPNIRKGKKIKKGYTIGRVDDELVFEVTQKSYHINPISLFQ